MKKIASTLLMAVMILSMCTGISAESVSAAEKLKVKRSGDYKYTVTNDKATITKYKGSVQELEIPSQLDGYSVTAIGERVFEGSKNLTKVVIPDSVTEIRDRAFYNCEDLSEISLPDKIRLIDALAFSDCDELVSVKIRGKSARIGENAFSDCDKLSSVTIGKGVNAIEANAFCDCKVLSEITIADSVKYIAADVFTGTKYYRNKENWKDENLYINNSLIRASKSAKGEYKIPDSVTAIAGGAFAGCRKITKVIIPDGIKSVGEVTFKGCKKLKNVTIPSSVNYIGLMAFANCSKLAKISLPDKINIIGEDAFSGTAFYKNSKNWKEKVLYNGKYLIKAKEKLSKPLKIKSGTRTIADGCFFECKKLSVLFIPASLKNIGNGAFYECIKLNCVFYKGSRKQWQKINIGQQDNRPLKKAKMHYNNDKGGKYQKTYAPTCYYYGYDLYYCSVHKKTYQTNYVDRLGHKAIYKTYNDGSRKRVCKYCEMSMEGSFPITIIR